MQTATIPTTRVPFAAAVACDPDAELAALWSGYLGTWRLLIAAPATAARAAAVGDPGDGRPGAGAGQ